MDAAGYWVELTARSGPDDKKKIYVNLANVASIGRYSKDGGAVIKFSGQDKDYETVRENPEEVFDAPRVYPMHDTRK